jgi:hypothetical protein
MSGPPGRGIVMEMLPALKYLCQGAKSGGDQWAVFPEEHSQQNGSVIYPPEQHHTVRWRQVRLDNV